MNCFKSSNATSTRGRSDEHSDTVDGIINLTLGILHIGGDAVSAAPVPGLTVAVNTLILILKKIQVRQH